MTLRDEYNTVVEIWKQEGKVEWKAWIKYDEVVTNVNCGHKPCGLALYMGKSQDDLYLDWTEAQRLKTRHTAKGQERSGN